MRQSTLPGATAFRSGLEIVGATYMRAARILLLRQAVTTAPAPVAEPLPVLEPLMPAVMPLQTVSTAVPSYSYAMPATTAMAMPATTAYAQPATYSYAQPAVQYAPVTSGYAGSIV